ncbi:hypothetical protein BDZ91DRAFT_725594, partial [Kalaharituber pfeilii]
NECFCKNCYYKNPNGGLVTRKSRMSIFSVAGCMLRFASPILSTTIVSDFGVDRKLTNRYEVV